MVGYIRKKGSVVRKDARDDPKMGDRGTTQQSEGQVGRLTSAGKGRTRHLTRSEAVMDDPLTPPVKCRLTHL